MYQHSLKYAEIHTHAIVSIRMLGAHELMSSGTLLCTAYTFCMFQA